MGYLGLIASHLLAAALGAFGMYRYILAIDKVAHHDSADHEGAAVTPRPPTEHKHRPTMTAVALAIGIIAIIGTGVLGVVQKAQEDAAAQHRAEDLAAQQVAIAKATAQFKACVNTYAQANYDAQTARQYAATALRNAQQVVFAAQQKVSDDIAKLLTVTTKQAAAPIVKRLREDLAAEHSAIGDEEQLKRHFDAEQAANPYPLPPKVACP